MTDLIKSPYEALDFTAGVLNTLDHPTWVVPFSGGKDSTSAGQSALVCIADGKIKNPPKRIIFYMGDTQMEFWSFRAHADVALNRMVAKARELGLEAEHFITSPLPQQDFWVKILGYGHIPPTPNMRWCTDNLKIQPPMRMLSKMGWGTAPKLLGVRYGESERRDRVLSCTLGGECGPDSLYNRLLRSKKETRETLVQPIINWRQCAVWDFLTLIAPGYGFDNDSLVKHYGPDGSLRYGCWSCPLIFDDRTAEYLKEKNPVLFELIIWVNENLRRGGEAWQPYNRELFDLGEAGIKDGLLAMHYCRRLYAELLEMGVRFGVELLNQWQRAMIKSIWDWRESLPKIQASSGGQLIFDLQSTRHEPEPLHITAIRTKNANTLSKVRLVDDHYHFPIAEAARLLVANHRGETWQYGGQWPGGATWWLSLEHPYRLIATVRDGKVEIAQYKATP